MLGSLGNCAITKCELAQDLASASAQLHDHQRRKRFNIAFIEFAHSLHNAPMGLGSFVALSHLGRSNDSLSQEMMVQHDRITQHNLYN